MRLVPTPLRDAGDLRQLRFAQLREELDATQHLAKFILWRRHELLPLARTTSWTMRASPDAAGRDTAPQAIRISDEVPGGSRALPSGRRSGPYQRCTFLAGSRAARERRACARLVHRDTRTKRRPPLARVRPTSPPPWGRAGRAKTPSRAFSHVRRDLAGRGAQTKFSRVNSETWLERRRLPRGG